MSDQAAREIVSAINNYANPQQPQQQPRRINVIPCKASAGPLYLPDVLCGKMVVIHADGTFEDYCLRCLKDIASGIYDINVEGAKTHRQVNEEQEKRSLKRKADLIEESRTAAHIAALEEAEAEHAAKRRKVLSPYATKARKAAKRRKIHGDKVADMAQFFDGYEGIRDLYSPRASKQNSDDEDSDAEKPQS